jgi:hypothetical protein
MRQAQYELHMQKHGLFGSARNPKMQNGHYPEYECFIAKAMSINIRKEVNENVSI